MELLLFIGGFFVCAVLYAKWQEALKNPAHNIVYRQSNKRQIDLTDLALEYFYHIASYLKKQNTQIHFQYEQNVSFEDVRYNITFFAIANSHFDAASWFKLEGMSVGFAKITETIQQKCNEGAYLVIVNTPKEKRCYLVSKNNLIIGKVFTTSEDCYYEEITNA